MALKNRWFRLKSLLVLAVCLVAIALTSHYVQAQSATQAGADAQKQLDDSFEKIMKPLFADNCMVCHSSDVGTAGIRVDQLDAKLDDRQIYSWEAIQRRLKAGTMPPPGMPAPTPEERQRAVDWISQALEIARNRPAPKNGLVRRLTVSQYRNTLRELLQIDDDLSSGLPPDAVSKEGFLNNRDTLMLSPQLTEAYFDIAEHALNRAITDIHKKPSIQNFRVDLAAGINPDPLPEKLTLVGSQLLDNEDVLVTQLVPVKPFPFEPFFMKTHYRFIEGYRGNDTIRGWRDFDSIYHAVFADMRGSGGYPKGKPWSTAPEGLLLRPAIPTNEIFGEDATEGPKANFKIAVRELPEDGRFRVTVTAAKYDDGLLIDPGVVSQPAGAAGAVAWKNPRVPSTITIPKAGIYQVDAHPPESNAAPDATHLKEGLTGVWPAEGASSPAGKAVTIASATDGIVVTRKSLPIDDEHNVGEGDFSVTAWIKVGDELQREGFVSLGGKSGATERRLGWYLDTPDNKGALRFQTAGTAVQAEGVLASPNGVLRPKTWQHIAAVVRRGRNETRLYVNGYLVARGSIGTAQYDDTSADFLIGRIPGTAPFKGDIADVRLYRRPLEEAEILALVQPGKQFVQEPPERKADFFLTLGDRQFSGSLAQPAFVVVRLNAGPLAVKSRYTGILDLDRVVFTPLAPEQDLAKKFTAFEKRTPRLGVSLGLRRDCGSSLSPVGPPQTVASTKPSKFIFEGTLRNFPSPENEKDNVNYLEGLHEIGVHSEYTDGRDMPRLAIRSVEFEGPYYDSWPPPSYKNIFVDFERKSDQPAYAQKIIHDFATRAYRRPITSAEEAALTGVYTKSFASGRSFEDSIKDALLVALTSPQFLFITETSKSPGPEPLDGYELASKLSYFLWNGPPDHKTLQLAAAGTLRPQLDAEVERMIADPKFAQFTREFATQWLSLDKFQVLEPDHRRFPKLIRDTRDQLKQEPVEFVQYLLRNNLPVKNLIDSDFIVANEVVAGYYGLGSKTESGFKFEPLHLDSTQHELGGLLSEAAIMAGLSDGRESNPVKRGAWMARKIIAEPPNDPPPNVPALKEDTTGLTLRQRLEAHRTQPACNLCHSKIDVWGVPFEQVDAGGRRKQQSVDSSSTLPDGTKVMGVDDLKRYLAEDRIDQVAFSFMKHLSIYATGRTLTYSELTFLKKDELKLKANGYRMKDMVHYVVNSPMFLEK